MKPFPAVMSISLLTLCWVEAFAVQPIQVDAATMEQRRVVPEGFPAFSVEGHEENMEALRHLFYLHYQPTFSMGTLWDEWIPPSVLWGAESDADGLNVRAHLRQLLLSRKIDVTGYVSTHQHASIAHQDGWPFPFWKQGEAGGAWGWHFSLQHVPAGWHATQVRPPEGWRFTGAVDGGLDAEGWHLRLEEPGAVLETPELRIDPRQAPFMQLRWRAAGLAGAGPFLEWRRQGQPDFVPEQRFYFSGATGKSMTYEMLPLYQHPEWQGAVEQLRLNFGNRTGADVVVQSLFTQYDTRHNINNTKFLKGSAWYFGWTGDVGFLRENIQRMRLALQYAMTELGGLEHKLILTPWIGHEGTPGYTVHSDGAKTFHYGSGVGNNYWDLIPFGGRDAYATVHYYDALRVMAELEETIAANPQWNLP
jgi:hypothetical protein